MKHAFTIFKFTLLFASALVFFSSCESSAELFSRGNGPAEEYETKVPFTRTLDLIIVEAEIEGEKFRFLFDTGAPMLVSKELAEKFNLKKQMSRNVTDSQNRKSKLDYVLLPDVAIGSKHFLGLTAIAADLQLSPVIACLEIDGIIGANLMRHAVWKIDYEENMLYFTNQPGVYEQLPNSLTLPFTTKATYTPVVSLMIDSTVINNITFDTGSGSALSIGKKRVPHFNKKDSLVYPSYGFHSSGIFGAVPDTMYYTKKAAIIGFTEVPDLLLSINASNSKALLGTKFFEDFDVILDWGKKEAVLNPNNPEMHMNTVGMSTIIDGDKLIVASVIQGSKAEKLGIAFKDHILEVNGIDCSSISGKEYCEIRSIWDNTDEQITIKIKDKGTFKLDWQVIL